MTTACNLEVARRDSILKYSAPHLHEHDRNRLRRSGFKSVDLFSHSVLNSVEISMRGIDLLKVKNWIVDLYTLQEEVHLFHKILLKTLPEVLFVAKQTLKIKKIKDHHNPPEGVVVAEGNDYPADLAPGGRLQCYYQVWEQKECHLRVALILKHSYRIAQPIDLSHTIHSDNTNPQKQTCWNLCRKCFRKKAIIPVRMSASLGFYSRLLLVPEPGKKWRAVIDLSALNIHLSVSTFKMEMAEVIRNSICKGEWVVSVDLTDAYFHIPKHQTSQNLLRFHVGGCSFPFRALTFWYSNGSTRIHPHSQRGKAYTAKQRHSDILVSRWLVTSSSISADLHGAVKTIGHICPGTQLGNQL